MAEPISYRILLNLQDALQAISKSGGYWFNVGDDAVSIDPVDAIEVILGRTVQSPFMVVEAGPSGRPNYQPAEQMIELLPASIIAAADAKQLDPVARIQTYERLCADIEKAVTEDHTRGGLATDTRITSKQMNVNTGSVRVLAVVQLEIRVYREYGAPNG